MQRRTHAGPGLAILEDSACWQFAAPTSSTKVQRCLPIFFHMRLFTLHAHVLARFLHQAEGSGGSGKATATLETWHAVRGSRC